MKRKEEIVDAAKEYTHNEGLKQIRGDWKSQEAINIQADNALFTNEDMINTFKAGAEWADAHPIHNEDVDLEKAIQQHINECLDIKFPTTDINAIKSDVEYTARMFFELGLKAQKRE